MKRDTHDKYCQRIHLAQFMLEDQFPGLEMKEQFESFGKRHFGENFIGIGPIEFEPKQQMWTANFAFWKPKVKLK